MIVFPTSFSGFAQALLVTTCLVVTAAGQGSIGGQWNLVGRSGVSVMHAILAPPTNNVIFLERVELATEAFTPLGKYAWSVEYNIDTNKYRPLDVVTNTFCSAGGYLPNGTIVNLGGAEKVSGVAEGFNSIRFFDPCTDGTCDWHVMGVTLATGRWYPTVEALPDGSLFILGGSKEGASVNTGAINVDSFEIFPPRDGGPVGATTLQFMIDTLPNNLYPAVHLLPDGNLFVQANTKAIVLSSTTFQTLRVLPNVPGNPRSYPLTGGSILLPLNPANNYLAEVLICGGSATLSNKSPADDTCARIAPLTANPTWEVEKMTSGRLMPDLFHLADGQIMMANGCLVGVAGFGKGFNPVYVPEFYNYSAPVGSRITTGTPAEIPRMYHSVAFTIPDGRVMVTGSNPNQNPAGIGPYPTEFRVEIFTPPFFFKGFPQPEILSIPTKVKYGEEFDIYITTYQPGSKLQAAFQQSGFVTHSMHMSQRYVFCEVVAHAPGKLTIKAPPHANLAPPAYYMVRVIENEMPSKAVWVQLTP